MTGVLYVIEQLGNALSRAEQQIAELQATNAALQAQVAAQQPEPEPAR